MRRVSQSDHLEQIRRCEVRMQIEVFLGSRGADGSCEHEGMMRVHPVQARQPRRFRATLQAKSNLHLALGAQNAGLERL